MDAKSPGTGGPGFRLVGFPKEFEKNFWETFDKRYYLIFLITFLMFYGGAAIVALQDWRLSDDQISAMKKRVIEKIYDVEFVPPETPEEDDSGLGSLAEEEPQEEEPQEVSEKGKERVQESAAQATERRRASRDELERRSRQMQQEVANQGILAIATSAGGSGAGNVAYNDVLQDLAGGAGGVGDIGSVVDGTAGIRTAGSPGERTRGAKGSGFRADGGGTGIDDMITGESVSSGGSFNRRGSVKLASENVKLTSGRGSRDPEAITASINKQSASVEYCYKRSARLNPNLRGRIDLEISIVTNGQVNQVRVMESSLGDSKLEQCIVRAVRKWRFGKVDKGNVKIRVPFIF